MNDVWAVPAVKVNAAQPGSAVTVAETEVDEAQFVGAVAATAATVARVVVGVEKHHGTG